MSEKEVREVYERVSKIMEKLWDKLGEVLRESLFKLVETLEEEDLIYLPTLMEFMMNIAHAAICEFRGIIIPGIYVVCRPREKEEGEAG